MDPCKEVPGRIFTSAAIAVVLASSGGAKEPSPSTQLPEARLHELNEIPIQQLRVMLKGFPGDWRSESDRERKLPEPPAVKPVPVGAKCVKLVSPSDFHLGEISVRTAIGGRRSVRSFSKAPLSLEELSYLLWATQGVTSVQRDVDGNILESFRAAPSGGARYPLETYLAINRVNSLEPGLYRYLPNDHQLILIRPNRELPKTLQRACYEQAFVAEAPVVFIWAAVPYRTEWKYAYTAHRMIAIEAGHVCENLYLAAESFGAGVCALLGYHQPILDKIIGADGNDEFTIYLACVGRPEPGTK